MSQEDDNAIEYLQRELTAALARADIAEDALIRKGYRKSCGIPACNCGDQWTHGGNAEARLREISAALHASPIDIDGKTLLSGVEELIAAAEERDAALATVARYETLRPANEWKGEHALLFHASKKHPVSLRTAGDEGMPFPGGNWRWLPIPDVKEPK
jgi:hypothetical protein